MQVNTYTLIIMGNCVNVKWDYKIIFIIMNSASTTRKLFSQAGSNCFTRQNLNVYFKAIPPIFTILYMELYSRIIDRQIII